jgi:hypothetical protein
LSAERVSEPGSGEKRIAFDGTITHRLRDEVRELYVARPKWVLLTYGVLALVLLGLAVWAQDWTRKLLYLLCAVTMGLMVGPIVGMYWARWWPRFEREHATGLRGEVTEVGIRMGEGGDPVPWSAFTAAKSDGRAALLYRDKMEALPFHRSLFATDADWQAFLAMVHDGRVARAHGVPSRR